MKLISVEAINFLCYKHINFNFVDGVWLITGKNGAGKSSIFDMVCFAVYGKTRGDLDSVVKIGEKECIVRLKFKSDDSNIYKVVRKRVLNKKSSLLLFNLRNKKLKLTRPNIVETQSKIESIIGFNFDMFISSAYFGQERITNFMSKTPKERKVLL